MTTSNYDHFVPIPDIHETTTKLINKYPEMDGADCIFIYFPTELIYHQHYLYNDYNDLRFPIAISYWVKGSAPVTLYKGEGASSLYFRVKDDKDTHRVNPDCQFHLLKIHLPAFRMPNGKWVYRHEIVPITNQNTIESLKAIRGY